MRQGSTTMSLLLGGCLLSGGCGAPESREAPAEARSPIVPVWSEAPAMSVARAHASATRLSDGRVLVAGGNTVGEPAGMQKGAVSGEVFDPEAEPGGWSGVGNTMLSPHSRHVAVRLDGGDVLLAGGPFSVAGADRYDGAQGVFKPASPMHHGRVLAAVVALSGRGALIIGGSTYDAMLGGVSLASAELYDADLDVWTLVAEMHVARAGHAATLLDGGARVLVTGGTHDGSVEIYDPEQDEWSLGAPMSSSRIQHTATRIDQGGREVVLVAGGRAGEGQPSLDTVELHDTERDVWSAGPPMHAHRSGHTATLLENGAVLVVGGADELGSALRTAELFDPVEGRWVLLGELGRRRVNHTATLLEDGRVLVAGGDHEAGAEIYRLGENGAPCEVGRECASGLCVDGVCCGSECPLPCHSCALPGSEGSCLPAPAGTDPRRECGSGAPCADACGPEGVCVSQAGAVCSAAACTEEGEHAPASRCVEGNTSCPAPLVEDCGGFRCDPEAGECAASCGSVGDCAPGFACDLEGRCVRPPDKAGGDVGPCAAGPAPAGEDRRGRAAGAAGLLACVAAAARLRRRAARRAAP